MSKMKQGSKINSTDINIQGVSEKTNAKNNDT